MIIMANMFNVVNDLKIALNSSNVQASGGQ